MYRTSRKSLKTLAHFLLIGLMAGCGRLVTECGGTALNISQLSQIERAGFQSNSKAYLITPNPIDATGDVSVQSFSSSLGNILDVFSLPSLVTFNRLDNDFLKVRISSINDNLSSLAAPNSNGEFRYNVTESHYGETMAYHSITAIQAYVEALGFSTNRTRPMYVMPLAISPFAPNEVNAYYDHHHFDSSSPREMKLFGNTAHAPFQDRDIYWHEFGHFFVESLTADRGVDNAGDLGAQFTEGAAVHECLADYGAESLSNRGYIGRWIAPNFVLDTGEPIFPLGAPIRSALDINDELSQFNRVNTFDGSEKNLDRYRLAEWCSRVLWDIRTQLVTENPSEGRFYADRTLFAAASTLKPNTSISDLRSALLSADQELNCGIHERSIVQAFQSRGFNAEPQTLTQPLIIQAQVVRLADPQNQFSFNFKIMNPNSQPARNVRLVLVPKDRRISTIVYFQGYGDLGGGQTITVGSNAALPLEYSVRGSFDSSVNNSGAKYELQLFIENGPSTVIQGAL